MKKRSDHYNSYAAGLFPTFVIPLMAGIAFRLHKIPLAIIFVVLGLAGTVFFMLTINQFGEFKDGLSHPSAYVAGLIVISSAGFLTAILLPNIISIVATIIGLGGTWVFMWALNKEALKNKQDSSEEVI